MASAIFPLAEYMPVTGAELLHAFILGVETECRIGNAVYPEHYETGWHITGTAGVFGSAAACGKLLGLERAADDLGARHRRHAVFRLPRDVRHALQELPSRARGAERP